MSPQTKEWLDRFVFRLACQACWIKLNGKWGYGGHKYLKEKKHACRGGYLVARLDSLQGVLKEEMWGRIRQRTKPDFKGRYSLCQQFTQVEFYLFEYSGRKGCSSIKSFMSVLI